MDQEPKETNIAEYVAAVVVVVIGFMLLGVI